MYKVDDNMKNKKGFTLIELLAVIIILGITALIAIPIVNAVIDKAKQSSYKQSAVGLVESADVYYTKSLRENLDNTVKFIFTNGEQTSEEKLEYSGKISGTGEVNLYKDGKVSMCIDNGVYYATKSVDSDTVKSAKGTCGEYNEDDGSYGVIDLVSKEQLDNLQSQLDQLQEENNNQTQQITQLTQVVSIGGLPDWKSQIEKNGLDEGWTIIRPNVDYVYTNLVDVTEYNYIVLLYKKYLYYNYTIGIGLTTKIDSTFQELHNEANKTTTSWVGNSQNNSELGIIYLDISDLSGEYYPFIYVDSSMYTGYYYFYLTKDNEIPTIN